MKLFSAKEKVSTKEGREAIKKMQKQIEAVGGRLTFVIKIDEGGWAAKCNEFDGIVTGGKNKNPSEREIMKSVIDAVKTAFHIPIGDLKIEKRQKIKLPIIKLEREFQLC